MKRERGRKSDRKRYGRIERKRAQETERDVGRERKRDGHFKETRWTDRRDAENMNLNVNNCYFRLYLIKEQTKVNNSRVK